MKEALSRGRLSIGGWLTTASPAVAEALASTGYSWVALDMEHGAFGMSDIEGIFIAIENGGAVPFVRLPSLDGHLARRLLDLGAYGFILSTTEDSGGLSEFVRFCHYPPDGRRGMCLSRANGWGARFDDYVASFRPVIVPQIETVRGIDNIDAIAAVGAVDGIFLGPMDLSRSLGCAPSFDIPVFRQAVERVRKACVAHNIAPGIHQVTPDLAQLRARIDEGFTFLAYASDMIALRSALAGFRELITGR